MNISIKYGNKIAEFQDKQRIVVGNSRDCDFVAEGFIGFVELVYSQKYNNYVLINSQDNNNLYFNHKNFRKVLVPANFNISLADGSEVILFMVNSSAKMSGSGNGEYTQNVSAIARDGMEAAVQNQTLREKKRYI